MSKRKKAEEKAKDAPAVADVASATPKPVPPAPPPMPKPAVAPMAPPPAKFTGESKITFLMYCVRKNILERHRAGMATWAKSKKVVKATFSEWEEIFKGY